MSEKPNQKPRRRSAAGIALVVGALGVLGILVAAALSARHWLPLLPLTDETLIHFERAERRLRYEVGIALPGEPDLDRFAERLAAAGLVEGAPILIRIYKRDFELEIWVQKDGAFRRFATYPICRWSGRLGPKMQQGDRQTPEGFYTVEQSSLNPNSRWYRSFNLGFPNAFDRSHNRTGSYIMVHGGCGSIGCYAMTNAQMAEIWRLVTGALGAGQKRFQVQVYPFRMTEAELARHAGDPDVPFWRDLKSGSDLFEANYVPPKISVCDGRYHFAPGEARSGGDQPIDERCP